MTDPIYMKKNYARLTPSTPKFTSCCLQNSCRLPVIFLFRDGWLDIYLFLLKSPLLWKKKNHLWIAHVFPYKKFHQRALVKAKLIFIWTTTMWIYLFFPRIPEKLCFYAALEWKQVLKLCKLSQNRSVGCWPLLLPPLCFSMVWPTPFGHVQQSSQKLP